MKLRNKKTGEIVECDIIGFRKGISEGWKDFAPKCNSLTELNEVWEDYEEPSPLINNEKLRNLVRTWAKCCGVSKLEYNHFWRQLTGDGGYSITLWTPLQLEDREFYTIEELCGDEDNN